jgi:hypothetical protein
MSAHTPGPWDLTPGPHGDPDVDDCDFIIYESRAAGDAVAAVVGPVRTGTTEANARLIAAAPELLDALKAAVRTIRTWHGLGTTGGAEQLLWELYQASPEMKRINAAIAKAEGR